MKCLLYGRRQFIWRRGQHLDRHDDKDYVRLWTKIRKLNSYSLIQPATDAVALYGRLDDLLTDNYCNTGGLAPRINRVFAHEKTRPDYLAVRIDKPQTAVAMKPIT